MRALVLSRTFLDIQDATRHMTVLLSSVYVLASLE